MVSPGGDEWLPVDRISEIPCCREKIFEADERKRDLRLLCVQDFLRALLLFVSLMFVVTFD